MDQSNKQALISMASRLMPEKLYLKLYYRMVFKRALDLKDPKTYNEKLQWLKINDRNPLYTQLVDKYLVREYVSDRVGDQYLIPLLGVWDSFEEIDWEELPDQFVLKTTHDSGTVIVCRDKRDFDILAARNTINASLRRNYYYLTKEWPYKDVSPRIIAEQYMDDGSGTGLKDYKFFCFSGEPKFLFVASDRGIHQTKFDFFDMKFRRLNIAQHYPNSGMEIARPESYDEMVSIAKALSQGLVHVRVDLYEIGGRPYFGELTFYHFSGLAPFDPPEADMRIGAMLNLEDLRRP